MLRLLENRVLRILGPRKVKVTGEWRELQNNDFKDLYCSPNIQVITLRTMGWMGHVAQMGRGEV